MQVQIQAFVSMDTGISCLAKAGVTQDKVSAQLAMSFRELRDTTEILRTLEFPRLVSIENFRAPNFQLIAEILEWIVHKFDALTRVPKNRELESDRIFFIKSCVLAIMQKTRIKLNPKNLYMSDGHAVRELMPVLRLLYQTTRGQVDNADDKSYTYALRGQISDKKQIVNMAVHVASDIPQNGASVYDLLSREPFAKEARMRALSQKLNVSEVDKYVRQLIEKARRDETEIDQKLSNVEKDEQALDNKIERRKMEVDQLQRRLQKLQAYRPPNRDEFEKHEKRLRVIYDNYTVKFRNLTYLKWRLSEVESIERQKTIEVEKNMRNAVEMMKQESNALPQVEIKLDNIKEHAMKIYGNMIGAGLSDDDDDDDDDEEGIEAHDIYNDDDELLRHETASNENHTRNQSQPGESMDDVDNDDEHIALEAQDTAGHDYDMHGDEDEDPENNSDNDF